MDNKEELMALQEASGVNLFENDPDKLPQDDDELAVYSRINLKPAIEIAAETGIDYVFKTNEFVNRIKPRIDRDITILNTACVKHYFDPSNGIQMDYVDPVDIVHSVTEDPYHSDVYYYGEVKRMPVSKIRSMFPDLNAEELITDKRSWSKLDTVSRIRI